jgi:hypothetical protein
MPRSPHSRRFATVLVASEVLPPADLGGRSAMALAMAHQERAGREAERHGGVVLVRVGQGCVTGFPTALPALQAATALLSPAVRSHGPAGAPSAATLNAGALNAGALNARGPTAAGAGAAYPAAGRQTAGRPSRVRLAAHRACLRQAETALADPAVAFVRRLLEHAGPGEIVLSVDLHDHLREHPDGHGLQTTPIPARDSAGGHPALPAAHRLLSRPVPDARSAGPRLTGWQLGGAVALAVAAAVTTLALTLTAT